MRKNLKFASPELEQTHTYAFTTAMGPVSVTGSQQGLQALRSLEGSVHIKAAALPPWAQEVKDQLNDYLEGKRSTFDLPLAPAGTEFQRRVWQALLDIPFGKTCSYLDLSRNLGDVKAIRAVGTANGKNPIWIIIPCHRVIGSDGSLTGYAGGLEMKKNLLDHEAKIAGNYQMNLNF
ncbi:MAG: methylated-DNA--[protein]-cysteine S-methyltransferase [Cyclobacteriaceae bacterium]